MAYAAIVTKAALRVYTVSKAGGCSLTTPYPGFRNQISIVFSRSTSFLAEPGSLASIFLMTAVIRCRFDRLKNP